ncbi:multicopper oxidase [Streptomyces sp. DSM 44917]|uniref:Multicopper oxidase CueO n=1 Tax=Streptomyces boetiae TaxID=3075541 RepID=A0ABU2LG99_9ACTN|nr:multicopper oxidase [Streptomyces sp. DSM 44917]MDT0310541.1 multicopper oxidase [Streptomyces sp. DSM 44917]
MLRRTFLRAAPAAGGALALAGLSPAAAAAARRAILPPVADPLYDTPIARATAVPRFVNALPRPPRVDLTDGGARTLRLAETSQDLLGGGLGLPSTVWGFGLDAGPNGEAALPASSPGPTIVARAGRTLSLDWRNDLPYRHLFPMDEDAHWAFTGSEYTVEQHGVPSVVHVHGAHTDSASDGHPDAWYSPGGAAGPLHGGTRCTYHNSQEAAPLWYHDHTHGITGLNIYAGLLGFYLLRDEHELGLIASRRLPAEPYELELAIQDRTFRPDGLLAFPSPTPHDHEETEPPTFAGQVILVNGKAWPYLDVEPRQYRLRLLNASNARFYRLSSGGGWPFPVTAIGGDGGFLDEPHRLEEGLLLAPGERADVIADFRDAGGRTFDLTNDAPLPFPGGAPVAAPVDAVLQFRVSLPYDRSAPEPVLPASLRRRPYRILTRPARTRRLQLLETVDEHGRTQMMLGTAEEGGMLWGDPVTETPRLHTTEVWELYNTTEETHSVHLHLVQFQVLDEAPFTADRDPERGALSSIVTGERLPLSPSERGPKDTVRIRPSHVVRVKARFDKAGDYVWHCHLLPHEDAGMMRRFTVS